MDKPDVQNVRETAHSERAEAGAFASTRLTIAATVYALVFLLAWVGAPAGWSPEGRLPILHITGAISVSVSLAVIYFARTQRRRPALLSEIGLAYQIICCLVIALTEHWLPWGDGLIRGVSWICLVLISLPVAVPVSAERTLWAALLGASMSPVALAITLVFKGNPVPSVKVIAALLPPVYLSAGIAFVLARLLHRLRDDVREARRMGRYELERCLGKGGMGEVWLAKHRLLARPAAIKFVRPDMAGAESPAEIEKLLKRFEREARITASLTSPHTISLYDFGVTEDGTFYYVMERLHGLDLETLVQQHGPLPPARVIHLLRQACLSLAEAHEGGMIHRDIKPANIYTCRVGAQFDFVKVLDFGLVMSGKDADAQFTRLTREGLTSGTPAYMAPEMVRNLELDGRTDVYGLGCVGYWLLTGQLVFPSRSPMQMLAEHLETQPKPPSLRTERKIPEDLEEVVLACLEKSPELRPQSALALAERLSACADAGGWSPASAQEWWRDTLETESTS